MLEMTDWGRYRKCPQCFAETGEPCLTLSGTVRLPSGVLSAFSKVTKPHSGRKPKTPVGLRDAISADPRGTTPTGVRT